MEKRNYIPSFLVAYLLCIGGLNQMMGIILSRKDGIMMMNLIPVLGLLALHFFISDKKNDLNMDKKALLFVYYIVSVIVVYRYAFRYGATSLVEHIVYCFIPIYISLYKIDVEKLLKYITFLSVLVIPVSADFFKNVGYGYETIGMSTSYNSLPFVVAAILHFWYYRKNAGFLMLIGYAANIYYLIQIVFFGNRGPIISLLVLGILLFLHKFNEEETMKKNTTKTVVVTLVVGILVIYLINNFEDILFGIYSGLKSAGIEIAPLSKSVHKIKFGDLSNGRKEVFDFVKKGIKERFIVGNGISSIAYRSFGRIIYPHNLFLQMWYDLGAFVSIPLVCLVAKATHITTFKAALKKHNAVMLILLFTLSIPRLCYSAEFWGNIPFWFLMMFSISPNFYDYGHEVSNNEIEEQKQ